jgi:hypothetical protein
LKARGINADTDGDGICAATRFGTICPKKGKGADIVMP